MEKIAKTRETLAQIRRACIEIAFGCERLSTAELALGDLCELVDALRATYGSAGNMLLEWQSTEVEGAAAFLTGYTEGYREIDPELDHDGDTQPSNEKPEP